MSRETNEMDGVWVIIGGPMRWGANEITFLLHHVPVGRISAACVIPVLIDYRICKYIWFQK